MPPISPRPGLRFPVVVHARRACDGGIRRGGVVRRGWGRAVAGRIFLAGVLSEDRTRVASAGYRIPRRTAAKRVRRCPVPGARCPVPGARCLGASVPRCLGASVPRCSVRKAPHDRSHLDPAAGHECLEVPRCVGAARADALTGSAVRWRARGGSVASSTGTRRLRRPSRRRAPAPGRTGRFERV